MRKVNHPINFIHFGPYLKFGMVPQKCEDSNCKILFQNMKTKRLSYLADLCHKWSLRKTSKKLESTFSFLFGGRYQYIWAPKDGEGYKNGKSVWIFEQLHTLQSRQLTFLHSGHLKSNTFFPTSTMFPHPFVTHWIGFSILALMFLMAWWSLTSYSSLVRSWKEGIRSFSFIWFINGHSAWFLSTWHENKREYFLQNQTTDS